jgi:ankyrin repeat protein
MMFFTFLFVTTVTTLTHSQTTGPQPNSKQRSNTPYVPNDVDPLHLAVDQGNLKTVQSLLSDPTIDPNLVTEDGKTPLLRASFEGHTDIVTALLASSKIKAIQTDDNGYNALHCAAWKGHDKIVSVILGDGRVDPRDTTSTKRDKQKLATSEADKQKQSSSTSTKPIGMGDQSRAKERFRRSREDSSLTRAALAFSPLMIAANNGNDRVLRVLIKDGRADMDKRTGDGGHLIMLAAKNGHAKVVQTLLDLGVDVNVRKKSGETSLFLAALEGHANVVEVLLKEKNVNLKAGRDDTPLTVANWRQHEEVVQLLLHAHGRVPASALKEKKTTADVFQMIDVDSNNVLSSREISTILFEHFSKDNQVSYSNGDDILLQYDLDKNGSMDVQELHRYLASMAERLDVRLEDFLPLVIHEVEDQARGNDELGAFQKTKHPLGYGATDPEMEM